MDSLFRLNLMQLESQIMQQKIGIEIGNYGAQGGHYINLGGEVSKAFEVEKKPPEWKGNEGGLIAKLIIESPFSDDYKKGDISMGMYQDGGNEGCPKIFKGQYFNRKPKLGDNGFPQFRL